MQATNEAAPLSPSSSQVEQPKSATGITSTHHSSHARKRSLLQDDEPRIDHKKSSSKPNTVTSSLSRKRSRKEASVSFASVPHQTHVVPRWTEYEYTSSWYSKRDLFAFQCQESSDAAMLRTLIQATTAIEHLPQEPSVYRGLERLLSPQIYSEIAERRKRCLMSVLVAQHRGLNRDKIAEVSQKISDKGAEWALTLGST